MKTEIQIDWREWKDDAVSIKMLNELLAPHGVVIRDVTPEHCDFKDLEALSDGSKGAPPEVTPEGLLNGYLRDAPEWLRFEYHNDTLTNSVMRACAFTHKPTEEMLLELLRWKTSEATTLRDEKLDAIKKGNFPLIVIPK